MILVDSSIWIDFFRDVPTRHVETLVAHIRAGEVLIGDLVLTEVLQGCATDREFNETWRLIQRFSLIEIAGRDVSLAAARNYRELRGRGITVRKTIDTLIATRCIINGIPLLYSDRDFDPFVEHLGLIPAFDAATGVN